MKVLIAVQMPDDFLVGTLGQDERNRILRERFQDALDREYPNAPTGTVLVMDVASEIRIPSLPPEGYPSKR